MVLPPVVLLGVVVVFCPVFAPPDPVMSPGGAEVVPVVPELLLSGRGAVWFAFGDDVVPPVDPADEPGAPPLPPASPPLPPPPCADAVTGKAIVAASTTRVRIFIRPILCVFIEPTRLNAPRSARNVGNPICLSV